MQCAAHPDRNSVGYCKKCGSMGCAECLIKVEVRGDIGTQSRATEALVCRDCLSRIRPDVIPPKHAGKRASKKKTVARKREVRKRPAKAAVAGGAVAIVFLAIWAVTTFLPRTDISHPLMSADEVAAEGLDALAAGNTEQFLSRVDVCEFICRMDSTGMTQRDYEDADSKRRSELLASHGELLAKDLFVDGNLSKKFTIIGQNVKEDSASVSIKPWIRFGNRLYKRIVLENRAGVWKICGLASPDY